MNCWKQRNLSLLGKIAVIKSLLLPQLLYLFSVLCIDLPKTFFKRLDSLLFKFIWNNGNERGIHYISQLHNGSGNPKFFEDLVVEFDIPIRDRRKYDSLMNAIYLSWFDDSGDVTEDIFMSIVNNIKKQKKIPNMHMLL